MIWPCSVVGRVDTLVNGVEQLLKERKVTLVRGEGYLVRPDTLQVTGHDGGALDMLAHQVRDREVDDSFIAMMKAKHVAITSTLVRELSSFVYADSPRWLNDPFLARFSDPKRIEIAKTQLKDQQSKLRDLALNRKDFEIATANFSKMVKAGGVRIGLGTDSGPVPTRFEGYFEHMEMELMVKYGMTPMQVIQAFSQTNSEILGIEKDYGTLAKGKMADLVVLDKNPLDDILNTRTINAVYIGGRKFE